MTEETVWRRLWEEIDKAREDLWKSEAAAQEQFFKAIRRAIETYAKEVNPDDFDEYGVHRETQGGR